MTHQNTDKPMKPWSLKKRITTATSLTILILLSALILGGSLYALGRKRGLIKRQSIKDMVLEQALENRDLTEAYVDSVRYESCENDVYNFGVRFANHMLNNNLTGSEACRSFMTKNSRGGESTIIVTPWNVSKDEALEIVISQMQQVITDSFVHEFYDGSLVRGIKDDGEYVAIIIASSSDVNWVFELSFADPLTEQRLIELAQSFKLL